MRKRGEPQRPNIDWHKQQYKNFMRLALGCQARGYPKSSSYFFAKADVEERKLKTLGVTATASN